MFGWPRIHDLRPLLLLLPAFCAPGCGRPDDPAAPVGRAKLPADDRDALLAEIAALKAERDQLQQAYDQLQDRRDLADVRVAALERQLQEEQRRAADLEEQRDEADRQVDDLTEQITLIEADRQKAAEQLGASQSDQLALRDEATRWRNYSGMVTREYNGYRQERESGLDGLIYNTFGW